MADAATVDRVVRDGGPAIRGEVGGMSLLTRSQRDMFETAVSDHLGIPVAPKTLRDLLGFELYQKVGNFADMFEYARSVVRMCLSQRGPELFLRVIDAVDGAAGMYPELHQVVDDLRNGAVAWQPGSVGALWVPAHWPFIDRDDVRNLLVGMANGQGPVSLAIEGGSGEGKRTMSRYIEQLAGELRTFTAVCAELRAETVTSHDLRQLAANVRVSLGIDPVAETSHAEPERQAQVLANELAQEAALAGGTAWIVVVAPTGSGTDSAVLRFIDHLLGWVHSTPLVAARLSIIVITEALSLLELTNPPPIGSRLVLPQVTQQHVAMWLEAATPGKTKELYDLSASLVLNEVGKRNPAPSDRLQLLAGQCIIAQRKLASAVVT